MSTITQVIVEIPINDNPAILLIAVLSGPSKVVKSNVLVKYESRSIPTRKPKSANLVTINAFYDAATADGF